MIKFFCLNCGQKLAAENDAIGAVVSCTNCAEFIVVPPHSVTELEFFGARTRSRPPITAAMELIRPDEPRRIPATSTGTRAALIPHLARLMMNRLVQALFAQRANLLDTQADATQRMAELEQRIAQAQASLQKKLSAYETRIAELEQQLIAKEHENHQLRRSNFQLSRKAADAEVAVAPGRVSLRDAGFLLHA